MMKSPAIISESYPPFGQYRGGFTSLPCMPLPSLPSAEHRRTYACILSFQYLPRAVCLQHSVVHVLFADLIVFLVRRTAAGPVPEVPDVPFRGIGKTVRLPAHLQQKTIFRPGQTPQPALLRFHTLRTIRSLPVVLLLISLLCVCTALWFPQVSFHQSHDLHQERLWP